MPEYFLIFSNLPSKYNLFMYWQKLEENGYDITNDYNQALTNYSVL